MSPNDENANIGGASTSVTETFKDNGVAADAVDTQNSTVSVYRETSRAFRTSDVRVNV